MSSSRTRRTPRGIWVSPAPGSPVHSPFSKLSPNSASIYNYDQPRSKRFFNGWRTLKDAIRDGALNTRWKSGNNLVDPSSPGDAGLWSELHRATPVKAQIPHDKEQTDKLFGQHVGIWFVIGEPFAKGGFGEVRFGYHKSMSAKKFAVKIESVNHSGMRHLSTEYNIYSILGDSQGIPRCYYYGLCGIMHNALVMDLLGPSLDDVFESMKRKFSLRTVLLIALQALERLQYLHTRGVVHGDVKGENFLIGLPNEGLDTVIYIVDFGLSQVLKDHLKGTYLYNENTLVSPAGTPRYMSISAHKGNALSYRDDLESLAYVLVYFMKGRLPWQGINEKDTSKKSAIIKQRKTDGTPEEICSSCPDEFAQFLRYARTLKFQDDPDYPFLKQTFRNLLERTVEGENITPGTENIGFDWVGKTFAFRKNPLKHPILLRGELQKKISVPSLTPQYNEKLTLLHNQRSSATQLSINPLTKASKTRSSSQLALTTNIVIASPIPTKATSTDSSTTHRSLGLHVPNSPKGQQTSLLMSPRIQRNSKDVSQESLEKLTAGPSRVSRASRVKTDSKPSTASMRTNSVYIFHGHDREADTSSPTASRELSKSKTSVGSREKSLSEVSQMAAELPLLPDSGENGVNGCLKEDQGIVVETTFPEPITVQPTPLPKLSLATPKVSNSDQVVLPRGNLRYDSPQKKPNSVATGTTEALPAPPGVNNATTLHRISVYDVKRDGAGMTSLGNVGCFSWLKRRNFCAGGRKHVNETA